jgi:hypothetical protein
MRGFMLGGLGRLLRLLGRSRRRVDGFGVLFVEAT